MPGASSRVTTCDRLRQSADDLGRERFELLGHAEDDVGVVEGFGIGGLQRIGVRRSRAVDDQRRQSGSVHYLQNQRVDRLDRDYNLQGRWLGECRLQAAEC